MLESGGNLAKLSSSDFTDLKKGGVNVSVEGHTHVEADITDLDKYTQAEVDSALALKAAKGGDTYTGTHNFTGSLQKSGVDVPNLDEVTSMVSTALTPRGDWDASLGSFPTPTMSPERADFYHITVAGTMSDANPAQNDVEVQVGDNLYWHIDRDVWYKIDNTEKITSVNGRTSGAINLDDDYFTETELGSSSGSSLIGYDNTVSELTATNVQAAIDEVVNKSSAALTQAQFEANRALVNETMAASGFVHSGKHHASLESINEGLYSFPNASAVNQLFIGRSLTSFAGLSKTDFPIVNIAGVVTEFTGVNTPDWQYESRIKFPDAPDGTVTYDSATGAIVQHADAATAFAAETATNKVVTERVDHFGLEGYLEEVTLLNPHVYPNGLIQSDVTTMNGIPTVRSNRPDSYYAVFTGDTTSDGLGVNYWAASDAEKAAMRADPDNNIYVGSDGKVYQFRIRQRTIAGAGNGDWVQLDSTANGLTSRYLRWGDNATYLIAQGMRDALPSTPFSVYQDGLYAADAGLHQTSGLTSISAGTFSALNSTLTGRNTETGINGECYWLPLGTVSRLNQGAYHPSFNPLGAGKWNRNFSGVDGGVWWESSVISPTSRADAFNVVSDSTNTTDAGVVDNAGYISSGQSGRNDGRFYDAIYADGLGGVVDLRLSAQGGTISDILGTEDAKTKNATQRGLQKLRWTWVLSEEAPSSGATSNTVTLPTGHTVSVGDIINVVDSSGNILLTGLTVTSTNAVAAGWDSSQGTYNRISGNTYYTVATTELNLSVAGKFSQTDVIGDPANILATPDLANGWLGNWIPVIPDGTSKDWDLTRKNTASVLGRAYSTSNGSTWVNDTVGGFDSVKNSNPNSSKPVNTIEVLSYTAHAYVTEAANNPVVYKGTEGVGDEMFASHQYSPVAGSLFGESVLGIICKGSNDRGDSPIVRGVNIRSDLGQLDAIAGRLSHDQITLVTPNNNSSAYKTLPVVVKENDQLWLYYLSTQLVWDTTLDSGTEFVDRSGTASEGYTEGIYYHVTGGKFQGYWRSESSATINLDTSDWYIGTDGNIYNSVGSLRLSVWQGNGWGDDNLITVLDGEGTKTDLNGNTVKVSCHKVPYALGWVKVNT